MYKEFEQRRSSESVQTWIVYGRSAYNMGGWLEGKALRAGRGMLRSMESSRSRWVIVEGGRRWW